MQSRRRFLFPLLTAVALGAGLAAGCAGWPVQEVSDARQAITAAERAGAQKYAPETLAEAKKLLASARASAYDGDYRAARDSAEAARAKAIEARREAVEAKAPQKTPEPSPPPGANP